MPDTPDSECSVALRTFLDGRWRDWTGLPHGCQHEALTAELRGGEAEGQGRLSGRPARFRAYTTPTDNRTIWAWFDDRNDVFLLTETLTGSAEGVEALLRDLGEPERKLDQMVGRHADAHQWIYASRGLTLYVREHNWTIASVAGYAPSSASYYERYLGAQDQRQYSPDSSL